MRRKRIYVNLDYPDYLQLNWHAAINARCAGNYAKSVLLGHLHHQRNLNPELANRVEGWQREERERVD